MSTKDHIIQLLCSHVKLDRDKGVNDLNKLVANLGDEEKVSLKNIFLEIAGNVQESWEPKHGAFLGLKALFSVDKRPYQKDDNISKVIKLCHDHLTHNEVRIRLAAGDVLGTLCQVKGPVVYEQSSEHVLSLIRTNLERERKDSEHYEDEGVIKFREHPAGPIIRRGSIDKSQIFHDTAGWRCLETSMNCLQAMVDGCGSSFQPYIDGIIMELLFEALKHTNRFVRETACYVISSLVNCGLSKDASENPFSFDRLGNQVAKHLGISLSDNWSQVRLAASEATRKFLLSFPKNEREIFYPELLPKMCLNRYYLADGVRIYSQETWRRVAQTEGKELVQKYITHIADYYISQTSSTNHAVREASCACIAELALKIEKETVKPFVPRLLETLLSCFQDDSWPVRDAACLACGNFILSYPEESTTHLDALYPLFFKNLKDCIASVRQGAAGALANVVRAYGNAALKILSPIVSEGLNGLKNQKPESEKYSGLNLGPTTFSLVKRLRDNDFDLHSNQQMYSCGSLAPKMGAGCDHSFTKTSEPWEYTDGVVHLLADISPIPEAHETVCNFLPAVAEAASNKLYVHHLNLLETVWKRLPDIVEGIGKKKFKGFIEIFIDSMFYSLSCDNALTSSAASQCLNQISKKIGPNILKGRIQEHNPNFIEQFDANLNTSAF